MPQLWVVSVAGNANARLAALAFGPLPRALADLGRVDRATVATGAGG